MNKHHSKLTSKATMDCWPWNGTRQASGHGYFYACGKRVSVHRLAWEMKKGRTCRPGFFICHACGNSSCVNPAHLYEGTPKQNAADKLKHGTSNRNRAWNQKIFADDAIAIRKEHLTTGINRQEMADIYGVSIHAINNIIYEKDRRHLWQKKLP